LLTTSARRPVLFCGRAFADKIEGDGLAHWRCACAAHGRGSGTGVVGTVATDNKEDRAHLLEAGDSFTFKSQLRHRYANPSEREDTLVVWANTPITLRK